MFDLTAFSTGALQTALAHLRARRSGGALTVAEATSWGLDADAARLLVERLGPLPAAAWASLLEASLTERAAVPPTPELIWTGPLQRGGLAGSTAARLPRLLAQARRHVLLAGYAFDNGATLLEPLHKAMVAHNVRADFYIDLKQPGSPRPRAMTDAELRGGVAEVLRKNWPFPGPLPAVHVDARLRAGVEYASLHAKLVVVDHRHTLITSANFTQRGQTRNIEAGVYLDHPDFAQRVLGHFRRATASGDFERIDPR